MNNAYINGYLEGYMQKNAGVMNSAIEGAGQLADDARTLYQKARTGAYGKGARTLSRIPAQMQQNVENLKGRLANIAAGAVNPAIELGRGANYVGNQAARGYNAASSAIGSGANYIGNQIARGYDAATGLGGQGINAAVNAGKNAWSGIGNAVGAVKNWMSGDTFSAPAGSGAITSRELARAQALRKLRLAQRQRG